MGDKHLEKGRKTKDKHVGSKSNDSAGNKHSRKSAGGSLQAVRYLMNSSGLASEQYK